MSGVSGADAPGVADADLVRVGDFFGIPAFTHPDVKPGRIGIVSGGEVKAVIDGGGSGQGPSGVADADLEGVEVHINGSSDLSPDEAKILGDAMKRAYVLMKERQGTTAIKPTPYAKAFRERVCPVPEFPGIKNRQEDQA